MCIRDRCGIVPRATNSTLLTIGLVKVSLLKGNVVLYQVNLADNRTCKGECGIVPRVTNSTLLTIGLVKVSLLSHTHRGSVLLCTELPT